MPHHVPQLANARGWGSYLQQGAVVADDRRLADDHPRAVVQQHAVADAGSWVDVHRKHLADAALKHQRHHVLAPVPQAVGDAVRLDGMEAFVVQQRLAVRAARRVLRRASRITGGARRCQRFVPAARAHK
jgi:hypothetical protein